MRVLTWLSEVCDQVARYSSIYGQIWYVLVFGFRLFIVYSVAAPLYGDEKAGFACAFTDQNCVALCYDQYAKLSHVRLWSFELLAIATPTFLFHFYVIYVKSQLTKIKEEEKVKESLNERTLANDRKLKKIIRRAKRVGNVKKKISMHKNGEIIKTPKIMMVLLLTLVIRVIAEALYMWNGYYFLVVDNKRADGSGTNYLWMTVPKTYECHVEDDMLLACFDQQGVDPTCFISRPTEKTYVMRVINIITAVCLVLSVLEIFMTIKKLQSSYRKSKKQKRERDLELWPNTGGNREILLGADFNEETQMNRGSLALARIDVPPRPSRPRSNHSGSTRAVSEYSVRSEGKKARKSRRESDELEKGAESKTFLD